MHLDAIAYLASKLLNIADELVQDEIALLEGKQKMAIKNFKNAIIPDFPLSWVSNGSHSNKLL